MARLTRRLKEIEEEFQLDHNVQNTSRALTEWAEQTTGVELEFLVPKDQVLARFFSLCEALLICQAGNPPSGNDEIATRPLALIFSEFSERDRWMNGQPGSVELFAR